jgi:hypothetical protein
MKLARTVLAALLIQSTIAIADPVGVAGVGAHSCAEIAKFSSQNPDQTSAMMLSWGQGYMSGLNVAGGASGREVRDLAGMNTKDAEWVIRNYCYQHPMSDLATAVMELYKALPTAELPDFLRK